MFDRNIDFILYGLYFDFSAVVLIKTFSLEIHIHITILFIECIMFYYINTEFQKNNTHYFS